MNLTINGEPGPPERAPGMSITMIAISIALAVVVIAIALPRYLEARRHRDEVDAISYLKTIAVGEAIFREGDKEQDRNLDYGMLSELEATRLVHAVPAGYVFLASYSYTTSEFLWFAEADPEVPGRTGDRYFATNQAGVIFYSTQSYGMDTCTCSLPRNGVLPGGH